MKKEQIKTIVIFTLLFAVVLLGLSAQKNKTELRPDGVSVKMVAESLDKKLGDSWVEGNYKYTVTKRSGAYYMVTVKNNTPECSNVDTMEDPVPCAGGWYSAKDGESWTQSSSESIDCKKLISLGFPKDFGAESCYLNQ